jgi:V/A-type H+-transporting ATPase subunit I
VITEVQQIESEMNGIESERSQIQEDKAIINKWTDLPFPLDTKRETETCNVNLLTVSKEAGAALENELQAQGCRVFTQWCGEEAFLLIGLKKEDETIRTCIDTYHAEETVLPERSGHPSTSLVYMSNRRHELQKRHEELEARAKYLSLHLPELRKIAAARHWEKDREFLPYMEGGATQRTYTLEGWCPSRSIDSLYHEIDAITHTFELEQLESGEENEAPVVLDNKGLASPYESVTRLYGVPSSNDLDPTFWLGVFFFVFFGLCLTDLGYGLLLAGITGLIMLLYRVKPALKQLLLLLFLGGISSMIAGLFFGGYFGISPDKLPESIQSLQYFDPINEPLPFFYLTLTLGYIQIIVGFVLDIVRQASHGNFSSGIIDNGPWLLAVAGIGLYILGIAGMIPQSEVYMWFVVAAAVVLVVTQGRQENSLTARIGKGLVSLYGAVGYFADVLSYSRLLALGLATSALAFSVNLIADLVGTMVPVVGSIVMVIVLVVGHLFTLVVNTLGAYIHTARLQFVEFFNKFLSGTGAPFRPFKRDERHVILTEERYAGGEKN